MSLLSRSFNMDAGYQENVASLLDSLTQATGSRSIFHTRKVSLILFAEQPVFLPPAYVVRREGNVLTRVCPSIHPSINLSVHRGGYPYPIMLCNISQNAMGQLGGVPCQVQLGGVPCQVQPGGYPGRGGTLAGVYPGRGGTLARGVPWPGGTLARGVPWPLAGGVPWPLTRGVPWLGGHPAGGIPS